MKTFSVNSGFLYAVTAVVIVYVLAQSAFFLVRAAKRAKQIGIKGSVVRKTIFSSALFTIAPAVAILVGIVALSDRLGVPLPWLRLSVIGSLSYEMIASEVVSAITNATEYVSVAVVMTMGMLVSMFLPLILGKKINRGLVKINQKDKKWGSIFMTALFMGMISAFLGYVFGGVGEGASGWIPVLVFVTSAIVMALCGLLMKKTGWRWINDYALPFCIIVGMAAAIPFTMWLG